MINKQNVVYFFLKVSIGVSFHILVGKKENARNMFLLTTSFGGTETEHSKKYVKNRLKINTFLKHMLEVLNKTGISTY